MITKAINECSVNGILVGLGRFGIKEKEMNGVNKIFGSVLIATDVEEKNIIEVNFIPQAPKYKNQNDNNNYLVLKRIMEKEETVEKVGSKLALKLRVDCSLSTNPYYKDNNGEMILSEPMQVKGNFIHIDNKVEPYCGFNVDCLFQSIEPETMADGTETERQNIKVLVFDDYAKMFKPLSFKIENPLGINFINTNYIPGESYVTLSGTISTKTIGASNNPDLVMGFGEVAKVSKPISIREFVITAGQLPMDMPMTEEDMTIAEQNRCTFLANLKEKSRTKAESTAVVTNTGFGTAQNVVADASSKATYVF